MKPRFWQRIKHADGDLRDVIRNLEQRINPVGWHDLMTSISAGKAVGATAPDWSVFVDGIYGYEFHASSMNEVWLSFHIPHDFLFGNNLVYPHIHWSTTGTNAGVVRWGFEYSYSHGYAKGVFPASSTIYIEQAATGVARTHMIAESVEGAGIPALDMEIDGVMIGRVFRDAGNAADTCTDKAFAFFLDMHYLSDSTPTIERNSPSGSTWTKSDR